jgi:hypothetical protein
MPTVFSMAILSLKPPRPQLVTRSGADVPTGIERLIYWKSDRLTGYRIGAGDTAGRALQAGPAALGAKIETLLGLCRVGNLRLIHQSGYATAVSNSLNAREFVAR